MGANSWQEKDFTPQNSEALKQVLECSTSDQPAWSEMSKISAPLSLEEAENSDGMEVFETSDMAKDKVRGATIKEEAFLLPYSAILRLEGISYFLRLMSSIPSMTPDITTSLISYLQIFDSRCRQLVLGAGAIGSAGLENVTTKHLALVSKLGKIEGFGDLGTHLKKIIEGKETKPASPIDLLPEFTKAVKEE